MPLFKGLFCLFPGHFPSNRLNSLFFEGAKPPQVVNSDLDAEAKFRPRQPNAADQFAAHRQHCPKHMPDPCAGFGDAGIAALLAVGLGLAEFGLVLDVHTPTFLLEALFPRLVLIAFVRPYVTAGVGGVKHCLKMVGVVLFGGAHVAFADQLVFPVGTDAEFVTVVAFAVLLCPTGFGVLLAALRVRPFR